MRLKALENCLLCDHGTNERVLKFLMRKLSGNYFHYLPFALYKAETVLFIPIK